MEDFGKTEAILANMVGSAVGQVPGLGAFVIKNGQKVFSFCGGNAYLDSKNPSNNRPFTDNSLFRIASVSKQYTVYAIMQLVEQNKLKLDDEAGQYLGFELIHPKFSGDKITIRMLADHTSGLRDGIIYCIPP
ncbi:MAG: beta-lactamase family protein [Anaerovibrio sp.]|nr:beta-lactamase family protein [Anaerovibrio sp.]